MFIKEHCYKDWVLYVKCFKCWEFKTKESFAKDKSKSNWIKSYCKECYRQSRDREYCKRYLKQYGKLHNKEKNEKRKKRLRNMKDKHWENPRNLQERARLYINKNNLRPIECMICWQQWKIEFHHPSYNNIERWKEWVFVCISCHRLIHSGEIKCPEVLDLVQLNAHMPTLLDNKAFEFLLDEPDLYEDINKDGTTLQGE